MTTTPHLTTIHHDLTMRMLEVTALDRPTPRLIRVSLEGDALDGFRSDGPADHVKVFFPAAGRRRAEVPELGPQGIVRDPTRATSFIARDYTPRHHRLSEGVLELDIVRHPHGLASRWAWEQARVGDVVGVAGPRGSHVLSVDIESLVLCGDETALPAIDNWLHGARPTMSISVFVEVANLDEQRELWSEGDVAVTWVSRDRDSADGVPALVDALAAADLSTVDTFFWAAGGFDSVQRVRRHLRDERGVAEEWIETRAYWKAGTADHQEPHSD
ncbi:siderophore-interacting protein [Ilumatobacter nonamiensis]|uniref:siderophore-interacting protein n=1 Tax=Ilumatobacter nonamiensis TaxID=467093 RepID=UPI00034999D8|nr:siderophore-interacting protein [Ilumatobacter nonamiensis]